MADISEKRLQLYTSFIEYYEWLDTEYPGQDYKKKFESKYRNYESWENYFFQNETNTKELWNVALKTKRYSKGFKSFISAFTCDLEWASGSTECESYLTQVKKLIPKPNNTSTQTTIVKEPKKEKEVEAEITQSDILNGSKKIGLKYKGDIVSSIQTKLSRIKDSNNTPFYTKQPTGTFDKETEAAVIRFQKSNPNLDVTGKVDQATLRAINYELNPNKFIYERTIKKLVTEGNIRNKKKQKEYLQVALENGCIPKLTGGGFNFDSEKNIMVYQGTTDDGYTQYYYGNVDDETGEITMISSKNLNNERYIPCDEVLELINKDKQRIQNQNDFITKLKEENRDLYETEVNPALIGKQYKKIDITTIEGASDFFNKGEKFIYEKIATYSTPTSKFAEQTQQLQTWGFAFSGSGNEKLYGAPMTSYFGEKNQIISDFPEKNRTIYPTNDTITEMEITTSACTQTINKLYGAIKREPGAIDKINLNTLPKEKLQVYRCAQNSSVTGKLRNLKVFGLRTPPLEKLNTILNDSTMYGVNPLLKSLRQNVQTESKDRVLKNIVRENLIKYKLQKKDNLIVEERKIVKQRFDIFKSNSKPSKQTQIKFFQEIIQESVILQKQGFDQKVISEGIFDIFSGLFGKQGGESVLQTFKEYIIGFIIKKLTPLDPDGWMGTAIKVSLADIDIADIPKLTNCNFLVERLAKSLPEVILAKFISEHTKDFGNLSKGALDVLRNSFSEGFSSLEFMNSIKTGLSSLICPGLSKISTKLDEKGDSLVQKAMGS